MKKVVFSFLLALSPFVNATQVSDVGVNYVGIYGDGRVFASLDKTIPVSGCESATWLMLPSGHGQKKEIYSMLLSAKTTGKKIDVNSNACFSGFATIAEGASDFILVK